MEGWWRSPDQFGFFLVCAITLILKDLVCSIGTLAELYDLNEGIIGGVKPLVKICL